jgi:hypothetical protein
VYSEFIMRFLLSALFVIAVSSMASAQVPLPPPPDQMQPPDQPQIMQAAPPPAVVYVPVPYFVPFAVFVPVPGTPGAHHLARPMLPPPPSQGMFVTAPATGIFAGNPATGIFVTPPPPKR